MEYHIDTQVCVIGAGHAGVEAALACSRLGLKTVIFTMNVDSIAMMPCNPHIGGSSKGHLVREIDALGGEMGKNIDKTFIQSKMLNVSKGPAVHSLRTQADKAEYSKAMRQVLESQENLTIRQAEVTEILTEDRKVVGVRIHTGTVYRCEAAIICTGTYLNARCLVGEEGDKVVIPFSYSTDPADVQIEQVPCYLTYTNEETHTIIRQNIDRSPIYAGIIEGTGPRYCPSIEDKVVKFAEKTRHQVFIEPEGRGTNEVYVDGMSSSMPDDVQQRMYRTVPGLENCVIVKNAYAIEYDCINANLLKLTLETRDVDGLFCAGQFNGSSGYEEAAAQGLMAGINAAMKIMGKEPLVLKRSEAYIGVLIDDLVTKDNREPYRMMTSRAEYRLLLRQDNADLRLRKYGYRVGLISQEQYDHVCEKEKMIEDEIRRLKNIRIGAARENQEYLRAHNSADLKTACSLAELMCRPELGYEQVAGLDPDRKSLPKEVTEQVEINIRYEGYIARQRRQVEQFEKMENRKIPEKIDYDDVGSLRLEARQKLKEFRPSSIGQAGRLSGVTPADVAVLLIYLEKFRAQFNSGKMTGAGTEANTEMRTERKDSFND